MANKIRKKTPSPEQLNPDKETEVSVEEIVKDERTAKIAGAVMLLFAGFLFTAITSYCFTWRQDQDAVLNNGTGILIDPTIEMANLMGAIGAYVSHMLVSNGFGLASFLFCSFFFVLGCNLLFGKKVFNLLRNLRYVISGLLIGSVCLSFIAWSFDWHTMTIGGAVGDLMRSTLVRWIGSAGTGALLLGTAFTYIIWRFNPSFRMPARKLKQHIETVTEQIKETPVFNDDNYFKDKVAPFTTTEPLIPEADKDPLVQNNKLRQDGKGVVVVMPEERDQEIIYTLVEHDTEATVNDLYKDGMPIQEEGPETIVAEDVDTGNLLVSDALSLETAELVQAKTKKSADAPALELEIKEAMEEMDTMHADVERGEDIIPEDETEVAEIIPTHIPMNDYDPSLELSRYEFPALDLLETHGSEKIVHDPAELEANKNQIISTLKNYDIQIQRISATVGPTVTLYEIVPAPGVRISRIKNLEDDIALSLAALGIRIIAPIPGKGTIGIEVPNASKRVVSMKTLLSSDKFQNNNFSLPIAIGKKIDNENFIVDLASMPHLLMAGATGQGKSVGINTLLVSLLYKKHPSQLKLVLVDPKKVELSLYRAIEKHFLAKLPGEEEAIITDTKKVVYTLNALCIEMDNRYDLLKEANCRNLKEYNEKFIKRKLNPQKGHQYLPFIVLVIDEFADLIMTAGKEVEMPIARLAQLARAVGIHLIIATQRPSVNIITGTIKANFPARIAFKVSSKIDSRTILDAGGAEQLIGKGDMLVSYNGEITRLQCAFVDTPEVEHICEFIGAQQGYPQAFYLPEYVDEKELEGKAIDLADRDSLFEEAARLIVQNQMGSTSLIQRRMKLGYNRAGRLMDQLEMAGVVGPNLGSKAREVLIKSDHELQEVLDTLA